MKDEQKIKEGKVVQMPKESEPQDTRPKTPNEEWNYTFITLLGNALEDLVYGVVKGIPITNRTKRKDEKITGIIQQIVGLHQYYRTELNNSMHSTYSMLLLDIQTRRKAYFGLGRIIFFYQIAVNKRVAEGLDIAKKLSHILRPISAESVAQRSKAQAQSQQAQ